MRPDIERITRLIEQTAVEEILPRFRALADDEVREKRGGELVTVADEAAEARLSRALTDLHPGSTVVGEEAAAADPAVFQRLCEDRPVWVIDPVDGTGNFARGKAVFAVMVAFVHDGETVIGWIHNPITGDTAVAERGQGAWMGGRRLRVAEAGAVSDLRGTLHAGQFATPRMARRIEARRGRLNTLRSLRCAGAEYLRLASGETHFSLFTKMMPWDHAPGVLLHGEAGGTGLALDACPYDPTRWHGPGLMLAPDPDSWHALHDVLFGDDPGR